METPTAAESTRTQARTPAAVHETSIDEDAAAILDAAGIGELDAGEDLLTDRQRAVLEFERQWWRQPGAKDQAIRDAFQMSPTRYYQALNAVIDLPQAQRYDAALVARLHRLRAAARTRRPR